MKLNMITNNFREKKIHATLYCLYTVLIIIPRKYHSLTGVKFTALHKQTLIPHNVQALNQITTHTHSRTASVKHMILKDIRKWKMSQQ